MEYDKTMNLPKTEFPMRASLPKREPETLAWWEQQDIYKMVQEKNKGKEKWVLHDGPPYANGDIHLGTTLNKILKDIIVKYKSMSGYDAPYIPGWDTHGLPIAQHVTKTLGINRHEVGSVNFRNECAKYAMKFVDIQRESFKRLGVRADWDHPYLTLTKEYEAAQIKVFGEMADKGYIYKGLKPVYWCTSCETALAEAETEYHDHRSPSIYVKFKVKDGLGKLPEDNTYVVIWTTTPWTLPANVAISLHPDFEYDLLQFGDEKYLVAKELKNQFIQDCELEEPTVVATFKGKDLEFVVTENPLMDRDSLVINGDHVTLEAGTGCVHTAPGHGLEDYEVCRKYDNLPVISPVDNKGVFTEEGAQFAGMITDEANKAVTMELKEKNALLKLTFIKHQYPHCWRCKTPLMYRATEQWFASIEGFRKEALDAIENDVQWIPTWGKERIYNMVADRSDWCISRQRIWGVPIPIFFCKDCGEAIIDKKVINHIEELFKKHGSNIWFDKEAEELIPEGLTCPSCKSSSFRKETDIMDVWFDSGSSHEAVLMNREELQRPADLYLEGSDQHRGWFNSSLSTSIATNGKAPYKAVLTHGYVVDSKGRKMSKSVGNGVDPKDIIKRMGADILRLWAASADYKKDISASDEIFKQMTEMYRKIRNTVRFALSNLYDYDPDQNKVDYADLKEIDQYALLRMNHLIENVEKAYATYDFYMVLQHIHNYCVLDLSALYMDVIKDRAYASTKDSVDRRAVQTVLHEIVYNLTLLLTPVLAYTTEEIWNYIPKKAGEPVSVQLCDFPEVDPRYTNEALKAKFDTVLELKEEVNKALELARGEKKIGNALQAEVVLYVAGELKEFVIASKNDLSTWFISSQVRIEDLADAPEDALEAMNMKDLKCKIEQAKGEKCQRCWIFSEELGTNPEHPTLCPRCSKVIMEGE
jgi:isoleucyl-tRNA synthetase